MQQLLLKYSCADQRAHSDEELRRAVCQGWLLYSCISCVMLNRTAGQGAAGTAGHQPCSLWAHRQLELQQRRVLCLPAALHREASVSADCTVLPNPSLLLHGHV